MNKKFKKTLSVVLSLLTVFSCFGILAGAESPECCHELGDPNCTLERKTTVQPTCEWGYTEYSCLFCTELVQGEFKEPVLPHDYKIDGPTVAPTCLDEGYSIFRCSRCNASRKDLYTEKLPHVFPEENLNPVNDGMDHQGKPLYTLNRVCSSCGLTYPDDSYYKVTLQKIVKPDADGEEKVEKLKDTYAKKDGTVLFPVTPTLTVEEYDNMKGAWRFIGWKAPNGEFHEDINDFVISEPKVLTAQFEQETKTFSVKFYDYYENLLNSEQVGYKEPVKKIPQMTGSNYSFRDGYITKTFEGWQVYDLSGNVMPDFNLEKVTADCIVRPVYKVEVDQVTITFYSYDQKTVIGTWSGDAGTSIRSIAPDAALLERPSDGIHVFEFTGKWLTAEGRVCTSANPKYLSLYPEYATDFVKYRVILSVVADGVGVSGASYQVATAGGSHAASGFTDSVGRKELLLPVGNYSVVCVSPDKLMAGDTTFAVIAGNDQTNVSVVLVDNSEYYDSDTKKCTCICHSILGPIWIKILNLLYSIFSIRYVCCNDMFATHGDKLKYT